MTEHDIRFWGPVEEGEQFRGKCFVLQHEADISEAEQASTMPAFVSSDEGSIRYEPSLSPAERRTLAASPLSQCCGYQRLPCCTSTTLMYVCVPKPGVWYRLVYVCNDNGRPCYQQAYVICY